MAQPKQPLRKIPESLLLSYVKLDPKNVGVLHIRIEPLCRYLFEYENRAFAIADFEKALEKELNEKLRGKAISSQSINAVCRYIDDLSRYLTIKSARENSRGIDNEVKRKFFEQHKDRYKEVIERAKRRNALEAAKLQERFKKRFESDS